MLTNIKKKGNLTNARLPFIHNVINYFILNKPSGLFSIA